MLWLQKRVVTTDGDKAKDGNRPGHEGPYMPCQGLNWGLKRQVKSRRHDVSECFQGHCCLNG